MSIKIVYQSKTGFTKKYANWIKEALDCEILSYKTFIDEGYKQNDIIVYGSSLMANQIKGLKKIKEYVPGDKLILFVTGAMSNELIEIINEMINANLTEEEQKVIPIYYFQGGMDYNKLGILQRNMLKTMRKALLSKKEKTVAEKAMIDALEKSFDGTNKEAIGGLIEEVKKMKDKFDLY